MAFIFKDQVEALAGSTTSTEAERWFDDGIKDVIGRLATLKPELMHLFSTEDSSGTGTYKNGNGGSFAVSAGDTVDIVNTARVYNTSSALGVTKYENSTNDFVQVKSGSTVLAKLQPYEKIRLEESSAGTLAFASNSFTDVTCDTTDTSTTVTHDANAKIVVGLSVSGTGIPSGAKVASIVSTTSFTLSAAATATNANETLTFNNNVAVNVIAGASGESIGIQDSHRVLMVRRGNKTATEIQASDRFYASDATSLRRATEEFPVYYVKDGQLSSIPAPDSASRLYASTVKYGAVQNWSSDPSSISSFPKEFYRMPVLFTACKVLEERLVGYQGLPPNLSLPSVPILAVPTLPNVPTLASVPVAPIVNLSLVSTLTTVVMPDDVSLPVFTPVPDPSINDLNLSSVTPPDAPSPPVFSIEDAELQEAYTTQTLTLGGTAPVYTPPVMTPPDWSDANEWVADSVKGEDPEMVQARMNVINGQIQEFSTNLQASLNKFNEENTKYQADNQSDTSEFQQNTQGLIQKMSVSTNVDLQNKAQELQKQVQEYANKMQRYQAELSKYQADLNELVVLWTSNEMQVKFAKWQLEFQQELGVYQAKVASIIQEYQADISKKSSLTQGEVASFSAELQKESTKISSDINKYQAEVGAYSAEVQSELNLYSTETQSLLSVYTQETQSKLNAYGQEVQALVQDFTTQMQKAQAEYQWMQAQLQYCMGEYEKSFASYQPQQKGE